MPATTAMRILPLSLLLPLLLPLLLFSACGSEAASTDGQAHGRGHVYVALDEQFSRPLLEGFLAETRVDMGLAFDVEANKTVGLVSRILEERKQPRCSVFWNNELAHTVRLAQEGLLEPYASPAAKDIPAQWRDPQDRWTGFAARARILVVNTGLLPDRSQWPQSYRDLVDPKWKGRCAVARPLTGTTLTHFAALRHLLGEEEFGRFFDAMVDNDVKFLQSNGATLRETAAGKVAWAFTDTDDYNVARQKGQPVACVFPDQQEDGIGTMLIPNSVSIIAGSPDPEGARKLVDRIVSRQTEALLAAAAGAQIPVREGVPGPADPSILGLGQFRAMQWDVDWTAANLARCNQEFGRRFGL